MSLFIWLVLLVVCFLIVISIVQFLIGGKLREAAEMKESKFSAEIFFTLLIVYLIVMIGFGLIYFIFSMQSIVLVEYGEPRKISVVGSLVHSFYFSSVTLLTIGYGDIVPIGIGRLIAVIEALIGYILPTAFVLRIVQIRGRN